MGLRGRIAIVTGAGSGIGRASAVLFAKEGACVALVDRDHAGLQETLAAIERAKGEASVHVGDVGDLDFAQTAIGEIVARRGRLDVLMTAAGFSCGGTVLSTDPADWDAVFRTNVGGTWLWSRAAVPEMQRQSSGSIITLASQLAVAGGRKRLYRGQGSDHKLDTDHGARFRNRWNPRQCHCAWRHRHADAGAQLRPSR
jgi:2-keto-3-deoxy-L-fuconate dehydrogenase